MKICFIVKYPPIEGGVSMRSFWTAHEMAKKGHQIFVVTNANEVEDSYRMYLDQDDEYWYEKQFENSGGFVKVWHTEPLSNRMMHIPQTNPFTEKLSSVATQVIRKHECEAIFAYYLQPYGVAAHLASTWTGIPYIIKHAGSDLGRLMKQEHLTTVYREVVKAASSVWTSKKEAFLAMGVREENIWSAGFGRPPEIFNDKVKPLDLNLLQEKLVSVQSEHIRNILINTSFIDTSKPTIGIYGKVGKAKGSFDLVTALGLLKKQGLDFNFIALTQGASLDEFKEAIKEENLQDRTWLFPFVPSWKVPSFIRNCTAVCFLERDFPISFHGPGIPKEVFACGVCLITSSEIAKKQSTQLIRKDNVLIVGDPKQHYDLASKLKFVITNPDQTKKIGLEGLKVFNEVYPKDTSSKTYIDILEKKLMEAINKKLAKTTYLVEEKVETKRLKKLKNNLQYTSKLLAEKWDNLVEEYCDQVVAGDNEFMDTLALCEFLEPQIVNLSNETRYLLDIFKYEKIHNLMLTDSLNKDFNAKDSRRLKVDFGKQDRKTYVNFNTFNNINSLKPLVSKRVFVQEFNYNLPVIIKCLNQENIPTDIQEEELFLLFKKELNFVNLELQIKKAVKQLLDLCNGTNTVQEIISSLSKQYATNSTFTEEQISQDIIKSITEMYTKEIIMFIS